MADIFFGNFSNLLSSTEVKIEKEEKKISKEVLEKGFNFKKINKKTMYVGIAIIVLIAFYLIK